MSKGKLTSMAAIMSAMKDASPEIAKTIAEYLTKKTQVSYDKMEVTLKAAGYTVEQYFRSLEENSSSKDFVESYRHTAAIAAQIEIIRNSIEISDIEKVKMLGEIHQKEIEQQRIAAEELRQNRKDKIRAVGVIIVGIGVLTSKTAGPAFTKTANNLIKTSGKVIKALPKKR